MGCRWAAIVVVFAVSAALAQEKELISAPAPNLSEAPNRASLSFQQAVERSFDDRRWYWEADGSTRFPAGVYACQACRGTRSYQGKIGTGRLVWDLSGKHGLLPVLDLKVTKLRLGQPTLMQEKPAMNYGTFVSPGRPTRLWNKATQSLGSVMHR